MRLAFIFICVFSTIDVLGCTCRDRKKSQMIKDADFAVEVKVVDVFQRQNAPGSHSADVRVKIVKLIKGKITTTDIVIISSAAGPCAEEFVIGEKYLVTGSDRIFDYFDREQWNEMIQEEDSVDAEYPNLPVTERYDKYIKRISGDSSVIFTDMCSILHY
jgi:hypothetical protein